MNEKLIPGLNLTVEKITTVDQLATSQDVGDIAFVSTPSLLIFLEQTCNKMLSNKLPKDALSISAEINIIHKKAIGLGEEVKCSIHLKFIDEEKLFFDFVFLDNKDDVIAIGAHERVIINKNAFTNSTISQA